MTVLDVLGLPNPHMLRLFLCNKFVVPKKKKRKITFDKDFENLTNESSCGLEGLIFDESRLCRFLTKAFI
jgi:hypothetical protein